MEIFHNSSNYPWIALQNIRTFSNASSINFHLRLFLFIFQEFDLLSCEGISLAGDLSFSPVNNHNQYNFLLLRCPSSNEKKRQFFKISLKGCVLKCVGNFLVVLVSSNYNVQHPLTVFILPWRKVLSLEVHLRHFFAEVESTRTYKLRYPDILRSTIL